MSAEQWQGAASEAIQRLIATKSELRIQWKPAQATGRDIDRAVRTDPERRVDPRPVVWRAISPTEAPGSLYSQDS